MRQLKRSIAKANMRALGATRLFARPAGRHSSKFARLWRDYIDHPITPRHRARETRTRRASV